MQNDSARFLRNNRIFCHMRLPWVTGEGYRAFPHTNQTDDILSNPLHRKSDAEFDGSESSGVRYSPKPTIVLRPVFLPQGSLTWGVAS